MKYNVAEMNKDDVTRIEVARISINHGYKTRKYPSLALFNLIMDDLINRTGRGKD